jgi:hypothetical protein
VTGGDATGDTILSFENAVTGVGNDALTGTAGANLFNAGGAAGNAWLCLGSGTTIMAAEKVGRRAYGIELDPGYVDVAIDDASAGRNRVPELHQYLCNGEI